MNKIIKMVKSAKNIALFTHITPDGDALGSVFALKNALLKSGKKADVYINEKVPARLEFLEEYLTGEYFTVFKEDEKYDLMIALDCGDIKRLGDFEEVFRNFGNTAVIDHHFSNTGYGKENYIRAHGSSTGEVIFDFLKKGRFKTDEKIASLLYSAIASDTGCFKYESANSRTYTVASELLKMGAEHSKICRLLFDTDDLKTLKLQSLAIEKVELFYDSRVAIVVITNDDLLKAGAIYEDAESLIEIPRRIKGVEVAIVIKEWKDRVKASIRTKEYVDASAFAGFYGGGGHIRAAGVATDKDVETLKQDMVQKIKELLK